MSKKKTGIEIIDDKELAKEVYDILGELCCDIVNSSDCFNNNKSRKKLIRKIIIILKEIDEKIVTSNITIRVDAIIGAVLIRRFIFSYIPEVDERLCKLLTEEQKKRLPEDFMTLIESIKYLPYPVYISLKELLKEFIEVIEVEEQ